LSFGLYSVNDKTSSLTANEGVTMLRNLGISFLCILALASALWGQGGTATLNGTILDQAAAVVPGAVVTATNNQTGVEHTATSTSAGSYTVPYLPPGNYTVAVSAAGFQRSVAENIILRQAQTQTLDLTLQVGQVTESITVSSTPPLLDAGSAEMGSYITQEEYKAWPIFVSDGQRQIQEFIFQSLPGVTGNTFQGSINGGQNYSHEILIEGIPIGRSDLSGGNNNEFSPSAEAISEFKLQTGAIGAQYNGGQTAVANFGVKSGTNELHGSAFYYGQNEALNSFSLADKSLNANPKKSRFRQHNYGYSVGGPIYIPKVVDGRNRAFFFTNFEKTTRNQLGFSGFETLPTQAFKDGDFSGLYDPGFTLNANSGTTIGTDAAGNAVIFGQLYDPRSTAAGPNGSTIRTPFSNNIIPQNRINPVANAVVNDIGIADPTLPGMVRNIPRIATSSPFFNLDTIGVKTDVHINDRHRISGYYNDSYRQRNNNGAARYLPIPGLPTSSWQVQTTPGQMVRLSLDSTFSATMLNRLAAGYNRFRNVNGNPPERVGIDWAGQIGIRNTDATYFPVFRFQGAEVQGGGNAGIARGRIGIPFHSDAPNGSTVIQDDLTVLRGSHSFRFGYGYTRYFYNDRSLSSPGDFTFNPRQTNLPGFANQTGHSFASFMLGAVNNAGRDISALTAGFRQPYHAFYVLDDWKVTNKLTVNVGLRWEVIPPFYEVTDRLSFVDLDAPNPDANNLPGALVFQDRASDTYWKMFGPRFGFAYRMMDKVVVRGGYAITNTPPIRNDWGYGPFTRGFNGNIPVRPGTSPTGFVDDPAMYLDQPYPSLAAPLPDTNPSQANFDSVSTTAPDANRPGYVQNWNMTVQYEIGAGTVLEAAYIGNKGTRLWGGSDGVAQSEMNPLPASILSHGDILRENVGDHPSYKPYADYPDDVSVAQSLRRFPQYFTVQEEFPYNSNSNYHSLQLTATKHLTGGLGFLAAYTWSKTLSHVDDNGPGAYYATIQDYFNRGLERSVAAFHRPHIFKLTWVYETPIGKGKRWDLGGFNYLVGGWQLSGVHQYQTGAALAISQSGISSPDGFSAGIRPDVTGEDYSLGGAPGKTDFFVPVSYLNPGAFEESPRTGDGVPLRVGTAPRYIDGVRGPHSVSEQFRLSKYFDIYERLKFQIGLTMNNPFNRTFREFVSLGVGDSGFGQLQQRGDGRELQLDARFEW
jgi:hypothetical protein